MSGPVACVWPVAAMLGEGPVWDRWAGCLWFVDIRQGMLHRYEPEGGARASIALGGNPGFVLPAVGGGLVIGNRATLSHLEDGRTRILAELPIGADDRCNDATVDRAGRIWFGTMHDPETDSSGRVFLYDRGAVSVVGGDAIVTNGPAVTADGRWLYHVDSTGRTIWRFDIAARDRLVDGTPFLRLPEGGAAPDGVVLDAEDHLWVGVWGGWCARRYAPDGRLVEEIALPCANVTKLAFGGSDLRTAYVTTARVGNTAASLAEQGLAGGLFAFRADVPGRPLPLAETG